MSDAPFPIRLQVCGRGEAPPLVLGNSLATDSRVWDCVLAPLAQDRPVVRFDAPGHGGQPAEPMHGLESLADRLVAALSACGIERFDYAGLSMGGALGMALALRHPARLRRLVLSNTAARFGDRSFWQDRMERAGREGMAALARPTVARWLTPEHARDEPALVARLEAMVAATSLEGYLACCAVVRDFDARAWLPSLTTPTLVIASTGDLATPPALGRDIATVVPRALLRELPGAHLGHLGAPHEWVAAVHHFLTAGATPCTT